MIVAFYSVLNIHCPTLLEDPMAPKKKALKSLPKKSVSSKKAAVVKGGKRKLAANHNQTLRSR